MIGVSAIFTVFLVQKVALSFASTEKFPTRLISRAENSDGSLPIYKNPHASIEARVEDLLPRMTVEEKVAQMYVK